MNFDADHYRDAEDRAFAERNLSGAGPPVEPLPTDRPLVNRLRWEAILKDAQERAGGAPRAGRDPWGIYE